MFVFFCFYFWYFLFFLFFGFVFFVCVCAFLLVCQAGMSVLAGRRLRMLVALLALWGALVFAHAAPPSSEEGGTVAKVGSGLPSGSVFRGAPPLHQAGGRGTSAALRHNIINLKLVCGVALHIADREPSNGCFASLHGGVPGAVFDEKGDVENIMTRIRGRQLNTVRHRADALKETEEAAVAGFEFRTASLPRQMAATNPHFVADLKLYVTVMCVMVELLCPLCAQDVGLRAVAKTAEELRHRRGKGRGKGAHNVNICCCHWVLANHHLKGAELC